MHLRDVSKIIVIKANNEWNINVFFEVLLIIQ